MDRSFGQPLFELSFANCGFLGYRRLGLELPSGDEPRTIDLNQHHQILELVASGDGTGAAELARTHIANSLTASITGALEERENIQPANLEKTA
jgi:DNA-binding GntR family transcriptional regulator